MTQKRTGSDASWGRLGADHVLSHRPSVIASPLTVSSPHLLNTGDLDWESVEHLVTWLVRKVEGWEEAWLYGERGQDQHGIDVAGVSGTDAAVFQAKRLKRFTLRDLEEAVDRFARGKRPFGASRFVVVTTHDANRTEIADRLIELRREHTDLTIELWHRKRLSDMLKPHPEIVTAFFGPATTAAFCPAPMTAAPSAAELAGDQPESQALLRGPVAHLGLDGELAEADRVREQAPEQAAEAYGRIAEQLEQTLYAPHANWLRARQAAALHASGDDDAALRIDLLNMAGDLSDGRVFQARQVIVRLADEQTAADDALTRSINTLGCLAEFEFEHQVTLADVADFLDQQVPDDPSVQLAAALFAEHAMAARRPELVREREDFLVAIAASGRPGHLDTARLQACLADADPTGATWRDLHRTARHTYPLEVRGLLAARRARFLALNGDGPGAVDGYYDAVEHALAARTHRDAQEWLAAQRLVLSRLATTTQERSKILDVHDFERVLRQASNDSVLPTTSDPRASAMFDLLREKYHDARQNLLQYRRRAVALGSWGHECEAEQLLARLHVGVGNVTTAMDHLVNAGIPNAAKEVHKHFPELPDHPLDWEPPADLAARPVWERTCAFALAERMADVLTDTSASAWADAALSEVATPVRQTGGVTPPTESAWASIAKLAAVTSPEQARNATARTQSADREHLSVEQARMRAVTALALVHETLAPDAVRKLTQAALQNSYFVGTLVKHAEKLFTLHPQIVATACADVAAGGNVDALRLLLLARAAPNTCRDVIASWLHNENSEERAGLSLSDLNLMGEDLLPPSVLAPWVQRLAEQVRQPGGQDRQRAALAALSIAGEALPVPERQPYVALALAAARGELPTPAEERAIRDHPLDRFRFRMGPPCCANMDWSPPPVWPATTPILPTASSLWHSPNSRTPATARHGSSPEPSASSPRVTCRP